MLSPSALAQEAGPKDSLTAVAALDTSPGTQTVTAAGEAGTPAGNTVPGGPTSSPPPAGALGTPMPAADPQELAAVKDAQQHGGGYPVLARGLSERVPFGYTRPTLLCQPLRVNLIRLEPGETVLSTITGDSESWSIHLTSSGPGGGTPIIVVKPLTEEHVTTNLFITTDRRIYEILLESKKLEVTRSSQEASTSNVLTFYYPDDIVQTWEAQAGHRQQLAQHAQRSATTSQATSLAPNVPLDRISFAYEWTRDRGFPWEPESVFDDGAHVYIKLPTEARHGAGAALFVRGLNGENTMLEYAVRDGLIITDRVFREAQFVYSEPSSRKKPKKYVLTIQNKKR